MTTRYKPDDFSWEELVEQQADGTLRFKVTVDFFLTSDGHEEAQARIHDLIKEGILTIAVDEDKDIEYSYDIVDCEVAELDM
jgi:hypothetical protein